MEAIFTSAESGINVSGDPTCWAGVLIADEDGSAKETAPDVEGGVLGTTVDCEDEILERF